MRNTGLRVSPRAAAETLEGSAQHDTPELPTLGTEAHRLVVEDEPRPTVVLQSLVLDHVLTTGGDVYWLDAANQANTASMSQLSPSPRILDRITVARAFTPYQHHELAQTLSVRLDEHDASPSLVVCPSIDTLYATDNVDRETGKTLLARSLAAIRGIVRETDAALLVTHHGDPASDPLANLVATNIPTELWCEQTQFGPRFEGESFETLVYPDATGMQTTLAFWCDVLRTRATAAGVSFDSSPSMTQEVTSNGSY